MTDQPNDLREGVNGNTPSWSSLREKVDHADKAYEYLNSAPFNGDPQIVKSMIEAATVHATLALHDKVGEFISAMRACTAQILDSQATLDRHIQTAAQHLHSDARDLKAQLRVIQGEAA